MVADVGDYSDEVKSILRDSIPVLFQMAHKYGSPTMLLGFHRPGKDALMTKYTHVFFTRLTFETEVQYFPLVSWT